ALMRPQGRRSNEENLRCALEIIGLDGARRVLREDVAMLSSGEQFSWSPDGSRIAVLETGTHADEVSVVSVADGRVIQHSAPPHGETFVMPGGWGTGGVQGKTPIWRDDGRALFLLAAVSGRVLELDLDSGKFQTLALAPAR